MVVNGGSDTKGNTMVQPKQFFKSKMRDEGDDVIMRYIYIQGHFCVFLPMKA